MQFVSLHSVIILKYRYKKHKNTDKSLYTILPLPLLAFIRIKTGTNKKKALCHSVSKKLAHYGLLCTERCLP